MGTTSIGGIGGSVYTAPVSIGGQQVELVIDTGSSDPWVVSSSFTCFDPVSGKDQDTSVCAFGPSYNHSESSTYATIAGENFNITYADHENLNGVMARDTLSMGGIAVAGQEFGLVDRAGWYGDGVSSGLVGFAYSSLTSAYAGTVPTADVKGHQLNYPTLFTSMWSASGGALVDPVFSIALSRNDTPGGVMALGGLPDVPHSPYFASAPIIPIGVNSSSGETVYQFYSIAVDGFACSASVSAQFNVYSTANAQKTALLARGASAIVDSGTSLLYAPNAVAAAVAAAFAPVAVYDAGSYSYYAPCDAVPPVFGVSVGLKVFYINPVDMLLPAAAGSPAACILAVQPNLGGMTILGTPWMKNVLAVFDIGAEQMRFAAREWYSLS